MVLLGAMILAGVLPTIQALDTNFAAQKAFLHVVYSNRDRQDLRHLIPVDSHTLYYTPDGVAGEFGSSLQGNVKAEL